MKKWFSAALFSFRWKKMTKWQRATLIASLGLMLLSAVLLCVRGWYPFSEDKAILQDTFVWLAFLVFVFSVPATQYAEQIDGRISQKYLREMNEIRVSLGRKPWGDI
jgi:F0F1-type ATP synthase assembly protein I